MNILIKQKDEKLKNFNIFKIFFCKYRDKKEILVEEQKTIVFKEEKKINPLDTRKVDYQNQRIVVPPISPSSCSEDIVAKTFNTFRIGQHVIVGNRTYRVNKIPPIDYNRTYLSFFLLVKNGFLV